MQNMKKNILIHSVAAAIALVGAVGCADSWDDHYGEQRVVSDKSLLQLIEEQPDLSDFLRVLRATHIYNNNRITKVTYADLLAGDQSLTVWAPRNGTFNVDSLLQECSTQSGDSMCSAHFTANHIARYIHGSLEASDARYKLLNGKYAVVSDGKFGGSAYALGRADQPAKNGLLHVIDGETPFNYTIYEALLTMPDMKHVGDFFSSYNRYELDEEASIQCGLVDGMKVYSDSVMRLRNVLYNVFGQINAEDSNYVFLMPTEQVWNRVYAEALTHFNYGSASKADSLQRYWASRSIIADLVYNRNLNRTALKDSVVSTSHVSWDKDLRKYHVFYKPLEPGGLFSTQVIRDSLACCNGKVFFLRDWPFTAEQNYFFPVKTESENTNLINEYKDCTYNVREAQADTISNGYLDITPKSSTSNWVLNLRVPNVLSGTYDICAVILPKTAQNPNSRDYKPNKFTASIDYEGLDGTMQSQAFEGDFTNNPHEVDTVCVGRCNIPVCSYGQPAANVYVTLTCNIGKRETTYSRNMYLDCLYFKPVTTEE